MPVIIACQLNREVDSNQPPELLHLAESGQIERDADVVIGMWRPKDDQPIRSFRVLKQRNGQRFDFSLKFDGVLCRYAEFV